LIPLYRNRIRSSLFVHFYLFNVVTIFPLFSTIFSVYVNISSYAVSAFVE